MSPDKMAALVKRYVAALNRPNPPKVIGCSHLGFDISAGQESISLLSRNASLLVCIYRHHWSPARTKTCPTCGHVTTLKRSEEMGRTRSTHVARRDAIARALKSTVITEWNGDHGTTGISFVLGMRAPAALTKAMHHGTTSGLEEFEKWVQEGLRRTERRR